MSTFKSEPEWGPIPRPRWIRATAVTVLAVVVAYRALRGRRGCTGCEAP